ncbi:hypothetical protein LUZ60_004278 [Juncus effusus]|nr:hypothetical protein LUZ60_004278 [Juncus effusus]
MRAWWRRSKKSKNKAVPSSAASSPRKKPSDFDEFPMSNGLTATSSEPLPAICGHPLPLPISLPGSVTGSASSSLSSGGSDETPDISIDRTFRYSDQANTQRGRNTTTKATSAPQRIHHVAEYKQRRFSDASASPLANGSDPSTSYTAPRGNLLSPPRSNRHSQSPLSPVSCRMFDLSAGPGSPAGGPDGLRSPPHPLPLPPGSPRCKSQWQKGKLLGRGTFGQVYLGFNSEGGHMCAIKEVAFISDDKNSKECLRQLNQEITLLSQLKHPNIVRYLGSELADDTLSVYLEYVSGGSVHRLLQEYGAFKEPVVRNYTRQILSGLAYLHSRNTIHRDIKGANILVGPNGEVKLADFGMAKHISSYTSIKSFKGSPYWIAPEVIMNGGYNLSADIWSLGCTIIEMATSKPPWSQFEGVQALFKIANSKDMPEIPQHFSSEGQNFLKLCLERNPRNRLTAFQLLEHPWLSNSNSNSNSSSNLKSTTSSPRAASPKMQNGRTEFYTRRSISPLREVEIGARDINFTSFPSSSSVHMSLPVSPCSSPLRQFRRNAKTNCLPSPSHPLSSSPVRTAHQRSPVNRSLSPMRPNNCTAIPTENWQEIHQLNFQSPYGSPKRF